MSPAELRRTLENFFRGREGVLDWGAAILGAPPPNAERLRSWVAQGLHAGLGYMENRLDERADPRALLPWARTAVLFSLRQPAPFGTDTGEFRVAAYALGEDYHRAARRILEDAGALLAREAPGLRFAGFSDTWPVFERDLAAEAGLGWRGKNACLIHRRHGSGILLAGFFLDAEVEPPAGPAPDFCGGCTACLQACPTDAFVEPGRLDAGKCISYWTIEHKGPVPGAISARFGDRIFGCDACQDACPWNRKPRERDLRPAPGEWPRSAEEWLALLRKGGGFQSRFKGTPLPRAGRKALLRNLLIALRNAGGNLPPGWRDVLEREEDDPAVRAVLAGLAGTEAATAPLGPVVSRDESVRAAE